MDITKIDAAKSQLATAIWLYFEDRDPISVHTLVHAASEIIDRLCDAKDLRSMRAAMLESIKPEYRKMVVDKLNKPANFFKHAATSKPGEVLRDFNEDRNLLAILQATDGLRLLGIDTPHAKTFGKWIAFVEPTLLLNPPPREQVVQIFGEIWDQPRAEQKKVARDALSLELTGRLADI